MTKPFIHLLQTINSGYFYDVNKNEIIRVPPKLFAALVYLCHNIGDAPGKDTMDQIEELQSIGYLSDNTVEEIEHGYTPCMDIILERKLQKMTLQLTQNCNFRCKYCVYSTEDNSLQRGHSAKRMTWETAKKALDYLWDHSVDSEDVDVGFYGGEPLLEFDLLKQATAYAKERFRGKKLGFYMTTNGTLLTDETIEFLIDNDISTMISLDGPKEINDLNRVFASNGEGTYDAVAQRLAHIAEKYPEYMERLHISTVVDPQNDFDCINSFEFDALKLNRFNISSSIVDNSYSQTKGEAVTSDDYIEKYEYNAFLAYAAHFGRVSEEAISPLVRGEISSTLSKH